MEYLLTKNVFFGKFYEALGMKNVGIFCDRLECFTAIWSILWPFGILFGHLV
jgi:hypothetical protein